MINSQMKEYKYFTFSEADDYGQYTLSETPKGTIKITINLISQNLLDNPLYSGASYIGLTKEEINDSYVIDFDDQMLKVKYINPFGRFKQVFMERIN